MWAGMIPCHLKQDRSCACSDTDAYEKLSLESTKGIYQLLSIFDAKAQLHFKKMTKGQTMFDELCKHISLVEKEYFSLRYIDEKDGQFNWLEMDKGIISQMSRAPLHFYFAVKFYPDNPTLLREDITRGMSPSDAEFQYLDNVRKLPLYGRDLHQAWDAEGQAVTLGISAWGVEVFHNNRLMQRFIWPKIITISFRSKKFSLTLRAPSEDDTYSATIVSFQFSSRRSSKRLWKVCVEHHSFFRLKTPAPIQSSSGFLKLGSKFRYSGRTQHQARHNEQVTLREQPSFNRVSSKRFSAKILDNL
ncbi:Band 4.1-like protein 1 [Exaiptasia diaphana]|nr:Band 4.1-like protein 1 [Exaiptasia diaphana]